MTELAHPDRRKKLAELREAGIDPFPARGVESEPIADVIAARAARARRPGRASARRRRSRDACSRCATSAS
jgi:hypothetical protein